jgi:hypothetical protein
MLKGQDIVVGWDVCVNLVTMYLCLRHPLVDRHPLVHPQYTFFAADNTNKIHVRLGGGADWWVSSS